MEQSLSASHLYTVRASHAAKSGELSGSESISHSTSLDLTCRQTATGELLEHARAGATWAASKSLGCTHEGLLSSWVHTAFWMNLVCQAAIPATSFKKS